MGTIWSFCLKVQYAVYKLHDLNQVYDLKISDKIKNGDIKRHLSIKIYT